MTEGNVFSADGTEWTADAFASDRSACAIREDVFVDFLRERYEITDENRIEKLKLARRDAIMSTTFN